MDKEKVLKTTTDLKAFFIKKGLTISEAKETIYRLLDYIDQNYDSDEREVPFKNGNGLNGHTINGNNYKVRQHQKGIKLEVKTR